MQITKKKPVNINLKTKPNTEMTEHFYKKMQTKILKQALTVPPKATVNFLFSTYQNNWLFQKFNSKIMRRSKKQNVENLFFFVIKQKFWKSQKKTNTDTFLDLFLNTLLLNRPRLELSKKHRKLGKSSAAAKKRRALVRNNKFLVPNLMPKNKQIRITLSWFVNEIQQPILNEKHNLIDSSSESDNEQVRGNQSKSKLKGRKKLEAEIKKDKKKRRKNLNKEKNKKHKSLPLKTKVSQLFFQVFNPDAAKSFFYLKLKDYLLLTGKQSLLNLKRWK